MAMLMYAGMYARGVLAKVLKRQEGQGTTEYVLTTLGVALFLVFAAMALRPVLNGAVTAIGGWVGLAGPPPTPP